MERKKYNLRSKKADTTQVSFDLHLSDDNEFITNLLGQKPQVMSHQDSDSSLSGSELECDKIIHSLTVMVRAQVGVSLTAYKLKMLARLPLI